MEVSGIQNYKDPEKGFVFILKNFAFWKLVLKIQGPFACKVKRSPAYKVLTGILRTVAQDFMGLRVTCSFVDELMTEKLDVATAIPFIPGILLNEDEFRKKKSEAETLMKETMESLQMILTVLSALTRRFGSFVPDAQEAFDKAKETEQRLKLGDTKILDLKPPQFLREFQDMLPLIEAIHDLSDSDVFWKVNEELVLDSAHIHLEDLPYQDGEAPLVRNVYSPKAVDEDSDDCAENSIRHLFDTSPPVDAYSAEECRAGFPSTMLVLQELSGKGFKAYQDLWETGFLPESPLRSELQLILSADDFHKEVTKAGKILRRHPPQALFDAYHLVSNFSAYSKQIQCLFEILKIMSENPNHDTEFFSVKHCFDKLQSTKDKSFLTLAELSKARITVQFLEEHLNSDPDLLNVVEAVADHSNLIDFVRRVLDDDIRFLIDAVEENFEQGIQESTVTALIDVKTFLLPMLKLPPEERSVRKILESVEKAIKDGKATNIPEKIADCVSNLHGLQSLFDSVANRGEMTKHIVQDMMQSNNTKLTFELHHGGGCQVTVTYKVKRGVVKGLSHDDLADLRSRALLLVNKEASSVKDEKSKLHFKQFISFADTAFAVASVCEKLKTSGHPLHTKFTTWGPFAREKLQENLTLCEHHLQQWELTLKKCRHQYSFLNFYYPEQLWQIQQSLEKRSDNDILVSLLKFAGYGAHVLPRLQQIFHETESCTAEWTQIDPSLSESAQALDRIGNTLDAVFPSTQPYVTDFPSNEKRVPSVHIASSVQRGQLYVAALTEASSMLIPTFLALFRNTTGCLPLPYQVLFCQEDTTADEIDLFLLRFTGQKASVNHLFSIACVECLENEVQFHLVDALKRVDFSGLHSSLAVICLGTNHPILDHFAHCVRQVQPLTGEELQLCLRKLLPGVYTVTSDLPGQGKTEWAKKTAVEKKRRLITLHVSGEASIVDILSHVQKVSLTEADVLHIDASIVARSADLDLALFRLIVLGFLSHRSITYFLPTKHVVIEVANSINNTLRNDLHVCMSFQRKHLCWNDFQDFVISHEICSSVQVVCHYLQAMNANKLDRVDVYFTGPQQAQCLPENACRALLRQAFSAANDLSFTMVNTFLHVLADQLKKLSCSYYFRTSNIADMLGKEFFPIKSTLVEALFEVSKEFSNRSVQACRADQAKVLSGGGDESAASTDAAATTATATAMVKRVSTMIQWSESNHLVLVFHNKDIQTLSALYRSLQKVPNHIKELFRTQGKPLQEIHSLPQTDLQQMLLKIVRFPSGEKDIHSLQQMTKRYALTPDNVLKMILIVERVKAQIPVIIMGETGCGKTSLIRYLSQMCDIDFEVQNMHAAIEEADIVGKVETANKTAVEKLLATKAGEPVIPIWLFFDEINTCNHMGLLNDILCHHMLHGRCLAPNLIIMAACNPYKLRNERTIHSAGLQSKVKTDELSKLVYRVNPLPESMVDYVWDYGTLSDADEKSYIERMVSGVATPGNTALLVDLLAASQKFIKEAEQSDSCVSLRDVNRCRILFQWFRNALQKKGGHNGGEIDAFILALAHCYHCRLSDKKDRERYRKAMTGILKFHEAKGINTEKDILDIISREESDLLDRMDLPEGTAKNSALKENVFVMFVCIMNCIPVFVVGKPGCSKSLSLQLIKSNLRGKDSKDPYFQTLPQLFCISFQGSESSTSDGISKVFQKAQRYLKSDTHPHVLPVVVLDEIGLAEVSRFNPLKVLHSLLEPPGRDFPEVAVVGISNWSLDAAKMNRAIHLSRTDMDEDELYETAVAISDATVSTSVTFNPLLSEKIQQKNKKTIDKSLLEAIAKAYHLYVKTQRFGNFHGLRDFYSLVKYITKEINDHQLSDDSMQIMTRGLLRNFGGLPSEKESLLNAFRKFVKKSASVPHEEMENANPPLTELVKDNVEDLKARHLMLITRGDIALYMIDGILQDVNRESVIILGSRFEEDLTDDYNYRILSRVILCMEQGVVLVLKDLDGIYGSLYDMLNQNYTTVGRGKHQKQSCRVALGPYSNPLCQVHPQFRCIVLVEHSKLDLSDPPFLNRFEKQQMHLSDVLSEENCKFVETLEKWLQDVSRIPDHSFSTHDLIPVFSGDFIPSLVLFLQQKKFDQEQILPEAKKMLLPLYTPEAIVRTSLCQADVDFDENEYWSQPCHNGLPAYLESLLNCGTKEEQGFLRCIVLTHSSIHSQVSDLMHACTSKVQIEKLGAFKSEKQLTTRLKLYWADPCTEWLVIQCSSSEDMGNFLLLKYLIDQEVSSHQLAGKSNCKKHCLLLIHLNRREEPESLGLINFLCGWHLAFVDLLEPSEIPLLAILETPFMDLVSHMKPLTTFIEANLFWAFSCIEYLNRARDMGDFEPLLSCITQKHQVVAFIEECILRYLNESGSMNATTTWQTNVACNGGLLQKHLSLHTALVSEVHRCMKHPLAALVYKIERVNGWDSLLTISDDEPEKMRAWVEIVTKEKLGEVNDIVPPTRPECYPCSEPTYALRHPFSKLFIERIDTVKDTFMESVRSQTMGKEDEGVRREDFLTLCTVHQDRIQEEAGPGLFENLYGGDQFDDYFTDFCCIKSGRLALVMNQKDRTEILKKAIAPLIEKNASLQHCLTQLHGVYWMFGSDLEAQLQLIDACSRMTSQIKIQQILDECLEEDMESKSDDGIECEPSLARASEEPTLTTDMERHSTSSECSDESPLEVQAATFTEDATTGLEEGKPGVSYNMPDRVDMPATEKKHLMEEDPVTLDESAGVPQQSNLENVIDNVEKGKDTPETHPIEEDSDEGLQIEQNTIQEGLDRAPNEEEDANQIHVDQEISETTSSTSEKQSVEKKNTLKLLSSKLVESTCVKLTPSPDSVEHVGSLEVWQQNISLILSLAAEVSLEPDALQCLRFCNDFTSCLMLPYNKPRELLGDLGGRLEHLPMDDENVYMFMKEIVGETKNISEEKRQSVMSYYVTSCLINNPDTEALQWLLRDLTYGGACDLLMIGPALHLALDMELDVGDEKQQLATIVSIVRSGIIPDDLPFMTFFDNLLQELGHPFHDHPLPCILIDVFQHCYFKGIVLNQQTLESLELLDLMLECHKVLISPGFSVQHIIAIAFLKAALQSFGETLLRSSMKFGNKPILQKLDSMLIPTGNNEKADRRIRCLQKFFFQTVLQGGGLKAILPFVEAHKISFTHVKNLSYEVLFQKPCQDTKINHDSTPTTKEICKLMDSLPKCKPELEKWIRDRKSKPEIISLFMCLTAERFFLTRGFRSLTDTETEQTVHLSSAAFSALPPNQNTLLERLCSQKNMTGDILQLTSESGDEKYQVASVLIHLLCQIVGMNPNYGQISKTAPVWQKLIQDPKALTHMYLPGCLKTRESSSTFMAAQKVSMRECDCGYVSLQKGTELEDRCLACSRELPKDGVSSISDSPLLESRPPDHVDFSVGCLSPVAYRVLQLFVHGCLLSSLGLGYVKPSDLQGLLEEAAEDIVSHLQDHILLQWQCLKQLTSLGNGQLRQFLHVVISSETINLAMDSTQFKTPEERDNFEIQFDESFATLVFDRFRLIQQRVSVENLKEGDCWDSYLTEKEMESEEVSEGAMPRALRWTMAPTVSHMKHEFLLDRGLKKDFPLMALIIGMEEELLLLQNLWTIIHWHFCCVKHASFKLKKMECQEMTVSKFIQKVNDPTQRGIVKKAFNDLKRSWNYLREHKTCLQRYNPSLPDIPSLHQECKLDTCIIIDQHSVLEELITSLVNMHNAFLLTAVKLSLHGKSPTISFLRSSGCQTSDLCLLPHVSLENVAAKQIIQLELDPKLVRFSQPSCRIGHGRQICFDFYQIEQELANETLINKPLLSNKLSSRIEFVGEAFLRPAALLGTINKLVPQDPLDREVKNAIDDLQKKNPAGLSELLNIVEMMLCLLKKTRGDKNMSAYEYMMRWKFLVSVSAESIEGFLLKISLRHSVGVYEYVESLLADMVIENREGPLPENMLAHMNDAFTNAGSKDLEILSIALKRFAYRALTVQKNELTQPLTHYLEEPSLWSEKDMTGRNPEDLLALLPPDAGVDHVQQLVQFIKVTIEDRKKSTDLSWMMSTPTTADKPATPANTSGQRKKTAKKWKKK